VIVAGVATALALAFVLFALKPGDATASVFAGASLGFVVAAAVGACSFTTREGGGRLAPARRGLVRCGILAAAAIVVCALVALARDGPLWGAIGAGAFAGLFALACGAWAHALGGGPARVLVAAAAFFCLSTLHVWSDWVLPHTDDWKASAARAFNLNPLAALSITLDFDWVHSKALYTGNETAESLAGVRLLGAGGYAWRLACVAVAGVVAGLWRKP